VRIRPHSHAHREPARRYHPGVSRRVELTLFWAAVAVLLVAHMFGFGQGDRALLLGWLPIDLAYRLLWMLLAACLVFWMTARLWGKDG
jgi:hypothetical protein